MTQVALTTTVYKVQETDRKGSVKKNFRRMQKQKAKDTGRKLVKGFSTFAQDELKRTRVLFDDHRDALRELFADEPEHGFEVTEDYFE